jgi:primosomal protein N' (replication factor Y)
VRAPTGRVAGVSADAIGSRVVSVVVHEGGRGKPFDYLVPPELSERVQVGTLVRVDLAGRRLSGWVVADGVEPPPGKALRPLAGVRGIGPSAAIIDLAAWAAWRWAGRWSHFLRTASPERALAGLPPPAPPSPPAAATTVEGPAAQLAADGLGGGSSVVRLPPAADGFVVVEAAVRRGPALIVCPSIASAATVARRLRRAGHPVALLPDGWAEAAAGGRTVVGARAAAFAPAPGVAAVVVLDAHDESHRSEAAPTWSAAEVAEERARRAAVPCALVSPCPTVELLHGRRLVAPSRSAERAGWAVLDVVDRRSDDPREGLWSPRLVDLVRRSERVVCVLNRKGRARLLVCRSCREVTRCERCGAASVEQDDGLGCLRCGLRRPRVCQLDGTGALAALRIGVTRAAEELAKLAGRPVAEVTGATDELPSNDVLIGTEAVLHRVDRAGAVCFVELDQELLAPRVGAAEQALALLARAARIVGPRSGGGRVLVQTRLPRHPAVVAALHGDPMHLADDERPVREALAFPPFAALARISGAAADPFVAALAAQPKIDTGEPSDGRWLVRAPDHRTLCDALQATPRPPGRLRVEVDPPRL